MAVFKSKYQELSFYVDGKLYSFSGGSFSSDDPKVIEAVSRLKDVQRVDTQPTKAKDLKDQNEPKAEVKQEDQKPKREKPKASAK